MAFIQYHKATHRNAGRVIGVKDTMAEFSDGEKAQNEFLEIPTRTAAQVWADLRKQNFEFDKETEQIKGLPYRVVDDTKTTVAGACEAVAVVDIIDQNDGRIVKEVKAELEALER